MKGIDRTLKARLEEFGCTSDPHDFRESIRELLANMYPSWTDEELMVHPRDGIKFCNEVRLRFGKKLPDELILRTLTNVRKSPKAFCGG